MILKNIFLNNLGLKSLALILAFVTWLYIVVELEKGTIEEREAVERLIVPYSMMLKQVPVELNITGMLQNGYIIEHDKIIIKPSVCLVIGPKSILEKLSSIKTEPIDISEHTRAVVKDLSIIPPVRGITMKEKFVSVTIPIKRTGD